MFREDSPPEIKEEPTERVSKEPSIDEMSREDMAQEILRLRVCALTECFFFALSAGTQFSVANLVSQFPGPTGGQR